jgi:hypothetical protein
LHFLQDDETLVEDVCEALINSRLAECWGRGESWARLDLSGRELSLRDDHKERLEEVCVEGRHALSVSHCRCSRCGYGYHQQHPLAIVCFLALQVVFSLEGRMGRTRAQQILGQLETEWTSLRRVRQKYAARKSPQVCA